MIDFIYNNIKNIITRFFFQALLKISSLRFILKKYQLLFLIRINREVTSRTLKTPNYLLEKFHLYSKVLEISWRYGCQIKKLCSR